MLSFSELVGPSPNLRLEEYFTMIEFVFVFGFAIFVQSKYYSTM